MKLLSPTLQLDPPEPPDSIHSCAHCSTPFSLTSFRPAGECPDGDLCQDCFDAWEYEQDFANRQADILLDDLKENG